MCLHHTVAGLADVPPLPRPPTAMSPPPVGGVRSPPTESCIEGHGGTEMIPEVWRYGGTGGTEGTKVILEVWRYRSYRRYRRYRGDTGGTEVPEVCSDIVKYVRPQALE